MMHFHQAGWGVAIAALFLSSPALAATMNGSFESDFTDWTTLGATSIQTASFGIAPVAGTNQALLINSPGGTSTGALETFLFGSANGSLSALGAVNGSAIKQTFTANAGDVITFSWAFLTNEFVPEPVTNDFAFVTLGNAILGRLDTLTPGFNIPSATSFGADTGYRSFSFNIAAAGTYTLGFGVVNQGDAFISSGLLIDNVQTVPEPVSTLGILALGGAGLLVRRRKLRT